MRRPRALLLGLILVALLVLMNSCPTILLTTKEINVSDGRLRDCSYFLGVRVRSRSYRSVISDYVETEVRNGPAADWRPVVRNRVLRLSFLPLLEYRHPAYGGVTSHLHMLSINWRRENTPRGEREKQSREYLYLLQTHPTDRQAGDYVEALSHAAIAGRVEQGGGPAETPRVGNGPDGKPPGTQ